MNYTSTRDNRLNVTSSEAIASGISAEGGLFVPAQLPQVSAGFIRSLADKTYIDRAKAILPLFLTDYTKEELDFDIEVLYNGKKAR